MSRLKISAGKALWKSGAGRLPHARTATCGGGPPARGTARSRGPPRSVPRPPPSEVRQERHQREGEVGETDLVLELGPRRLPPEAPGVALVEDEVPDEGQQPDEADGVGVMTPRAEAASGRSANPTDTPKMPAISSKMCSTHAITSPHLPLWRPSMDATTTTILAIMHRGRQSLPAHCLVRRGDGCAISLCHRSAVHRRSLAASHIPRFSKVVGRASLLPARHAHARWVAPDHPGVGRDGRRARPDQHQ